MTRQWNTPYKDVVRTYHVGLSKVYQPIAASLHLPSDTALDVKEMLKAGTINLDTRMIVVEEDPSVDVKSAMCALGFKNVYYHFGCIESLDLKKALDGRTLDHAFFDFCNAASARPIAWLASINPRLLTPGASLGFTFSARWKHNVMYDLMTASIWQKYFIGPMDTHQGKIPAITRHRFHRTACATIAAMSHTQTTLFRQPFCYHDTSMWMMYLHLKVIGWCSWKCGQNDDCYRALQRVLQQCKSHRNY